MDVAAGVVGAETEAVRGVATDSGLVTEVEAVPAGVDCPVGRSVISSSKRFLLMARELTKQSF